MAFDVSPPRDCADLSAAGGVPGREPRGFPDFATRRSPSFGEADARLPIVGLAPGLSGANRTGRPFTGDYAGDLLYATLIDFGFASGIYDRRPDDGLRWSTARSSTRCAACRRRTSRRRRRSRPAAPFSRPRSRRCRAAGSCVALGRIAHESVLRALGAQARASPFAHGARHVSAPGGAELLRQLPLLALQHEHRRADRGDVSRTSSPRARDFARSGRRRKLQTRPEAHGGDDMSARAFGEIDERAGARGRRSPPRRARARKFSPRARCCAISSVPTCKRAAAGDARAQHDRGLRRTFAAASAPCPGRFANRIANGRFVARRRRLSARPQAGRKHTLHGGPQGFGKRSGSSARMTAIVCRR